MPPHSLLIFLTALYLPMLDCNSLSFRPFNVLRKSETFVDRTAFIQNFLKKHTQHLHFAAPRGYGKTTILDMFRRFVETDVTPDGNKKTNKQFHKNYRTFANIVPSTGKHLFIFTQTEFFDQHFGEYPVIWLDFDPKNATTYDKLSYSRLLLNGPIKSAFADHLYLINSTYILPEDKTVLEKILHENNTSKNVSGNSDLMPRPSDRVAFLKKLLEQQFRKEPIVLVDNIDVELRRMIVDPKQHSDIALAKLAVLKEFLEALSYEDLKNNTKPPFWTFRTGALRPWLEPSFYTSRRLQKVIAYSRYARFYSLSNQQVRALVKAKGLKKNLDQLSKWYGFVRITSWNKRTREFNPYSIFRLLTNQPADIKPYWTDFDLLGTFKSAFTPNRLGPRLASCFEECSLPGSDSSGFTPADVKELQNWQKTDLPAEVTSEALAAFSMLLLDSGFILPRDLDSSQFEVPNLEVRTYLSGLLFAATAEHTPLNGDVDFRAELLGAIFDVDGSEIGMCRFADVFLTLFMALERRQKTPVDDATFAHVVRVHLLNPLPQFNVSLVQTDFIDEKQTKNRPPCELIFVVEGKLGTTAFAVKLNLKGGSLGSNETLTQAHLDVLKFGELESVTHKVAAHLRNDNETFGFSCILDSENLKDEKFFKVAKDDIRQRAEAKWKLF